MLLAMLANTNVVWASDYGVFGSIAKPFGQLRNQPVFEDLLPKNKKEAIVALSGWQPWVKTQRELTKDIPIYEKLTAVNSVINRGIKYESDMSLYGKPGHWASIEDTVRISRGDCEDYAIAKIWVLVALGVPLERLQLVVLRNVLRNVYHAVLAVHTDDAIYILDNIGRDRAPKKDFKISHYQPTQSFVKGRAFVHAIKGQ
jgi:predicted transglutaminase-like cysteine proteinase